MAIGNEFINWIKNRIEAFKPQPPESVWNNIADELDIEDVWQGINNELEFEKYISLYDRLNYIPAAAVILLLLLPIGGPLIINQHQNNREIISQAKEQKLSPDTQNSIQNGAPDIYKDEQKQQENLKNAIASKEKNKQTSSSTSKTGDLTINKEATITEKPDNRIKNIRPNELQALNRQSNETTIKSIHHEPIKLPDKGAPKRGFKPRLIAFGFSGAIKNQWLLSPSTMRGLERKNYTSIAPDFGKNIGIFGSFRLSKNLKVQGEGNFISEMGQKYFEYSHGQYIAREMNLKYFTLDILAKINTPDFLRNFGPDHSDFLAGFYSGYLHKANQNLNGIDSDTNKNYKDYDFGIVAGYEFTVNPHSPVQLKPSIRVNYGLVNIYEGNEIIPANFRKTRTASISLNLKLSFSNL